VGVRVILGLILMCLMLFMIFSMGSSLVRKLGLLLGRLGGLARLGFRRCWKLWTGLVKSVETRRELLLFLELKNQGNRQFVTS